MNWAALSVSDVSLRLARPLGELSGIRAVNISPPEANVGRNNSAIILSRLHLHWHAEETWLAAVRASVEEISRSGAVFVGTIGLAGFEYALWCAGRAEIPLIVILPPAPSERLTSLATDAIIQLDLPTNLATFLAPVVDRKSGKEKRLHARDQLLLAFSDTIYPLAIRPGGFWESQIAAWPKRMEASFQVVYPDRIESPSRKLIVSNEASTFLWNSHIIHFTRGSHFPWPGETRADYFRALTDSSAGNPRDGAATLAYILNGGILRGSGKLVRGGAPAISFTSCNPFDFLNLTDYRSRVHSIGAEPYGIAVPVTLMRELGASPVIYGDNALFESLGVAERPFFQSEGRILKYAARRDWRDEAEWRLVGDLDLTSIRDKVTAFAMTPAEANAIEAQTGYNTIPLFRE